MKKVLLGNSGLSVSTIGLGTVKFGRNQGVRYPTSFELPSDKEISELLATASDLGINLLDTAPAYGTSEERLGRLLKDRHQWILATKVGEEFIDGQSHFDFSAKALRQSVERSLKRLNTDYLDIVLVHSNGDDKKLIEEEAVFSTLNEMKHAGWIRAIGMSTKTIEGGMKALDLSDLVMLTYNPVEQEQRSVITYAQQKNKGILIKKALASGHIDRFVGNDPVQTALDFVFKEKGVTSVIIGTLNPEHLKSVVSAQEKI